MNITRGKALLLIIIGAAAVGAGVWLGEAFIRANSPLEIAGIYFSEPKPVTDFTLTKQTGEPFKPDDFKGHWTFLYFGYTYCPDVCPTTLAELNGVEQRLAEQGLNQDTAYMLISVDPQRDTPERLGEYVAYFNDKFQGATGAPKELDKITKQFGVVYRIPPAQEDEKNYLVDHSSTVVLVNPQAQLHAIFTPPHAPDTVAADFVKIRERYQATH